MWLLLADVHADAMAITCRQCHAPPHAPCRGTSGRSATGHSSSYAHRQRRQDWLTGGQDHEEGLPAGEHP